MIRTRLACMSVLVFALACGSSSPSGTDAGTNSGNTSNTGTDAGTSTNTGTDAGTSTTPTKLSCVGINNCANACTTSSCQQTCFSEGTTTAQNLFQAVQSCFSTACPQMPSTAPCATVTSSTCQMCVSMSQMSGGACYQSVSACEMDTSGSSSGGTGGTGGGMAMNTTCHQILSCLGACTTQACAQLCVSDGSSSAQSLFSTLNTCLTTACPSTTGSACATQSSMACQMCIQTATAQNGMCYSDLQACQNG